jgi:Lipocalin-like domain
MKKILLTLTTSLLIFSCATKSPVAVSSKTETVSPKVDSRAENAFKGNWRLTKVIYVGQEYINITSFQLADSKCFIGSVWNFIPNNEKGTVTLSPSSCAAFTSPIVWSVSKEKMFSLKILKDLKSRDVKVGFYFLVQNQTDESFELSDRMEIGGKLTEVIYKFEKKK